MLFISAARNWLLEDMVTCQIHVSTLLQSSVAEDLLGGLGVIRGWHVPGYPTPILEMFLAQ